MKLILIGIMVFFCGIAYAECTIDEVVDLYDADTTLTDARNICDNTITNSDCSITKIFNYANKGKGLRYIKEKCEIITNDYNNKSQYQIPDNSPASICMTPFGSCPMAVPIPKGASCTCYTGSGPIMGMSR